MSFMVPTGQSDKLSYKPLARIPERRSSRLFRSRTDSSQDEVSQASTPARPPTQGPHVFRRQQPVTARGKSASPIKERSTVEDGTRIARPDARTFVPAVLPKDVLHLPKLTHPRLQFDLHLPAPLFVGGATIEGEIHIKIDANYNEAKRQSLPMLTVHRVSATVVGVEHCKGRREIFNALMTHVTHVDELPIIADAVKPFKIDLPISVGPPPYESRKAGIRYLLSVLVELRISDETHFVRQTKRIDIISVHDPEKALVNLSRPLVIKDDLRVSSDSGVLLTAALHRQTWIGGYLLFVDLKIENETPKPIKRIDLLLEKLVMFYNATAPTFRSSQNPIDVRIPDDIHKNILVKRAILSAAEPILPSTTSFRTVQLPLPSDNVSITTARYFSVTHTLSVKLNYSYTKTLKISLPIALIHPNSIDIPPNAIAQVTASLEKARTKTRGSRATTPITRLYRPGSAFAAARRASLLQLRDQEWWAGRRVVGGTIHPPPLTSDIDPPHGPRTSTTKQYSRAIGSPELDDLARALEHSPRRYAPIRLTETTARPSIDSLAARPVQRGRTSISGPNIMERDRSRPRGPLSSHPPKLQRDDSQKMKNKRRRSVAEVLGNGSGDLKLSHFDGTGDGTGSKHLRRGSKSLDLGFRNGSCFADGAFDGSVGERPWREGGDEIEAGYTDNNGIGGHEHGKKRVKDERKGLRYRFPNSTEMAGLGSDESISTLRPDTPSPPLRSMHRPVIRNRSVGFKDEGKESKCEEDVETGTVNRTPKWEPRAELGESSSQEAEDASEKENREPALGGRKRMNREFEESKGVRGKWRDRFLFG